MTTSQEQTTNDGALESFNDFNSQAHDSEMAYANDGKETQSQPEGIETFDNPTPVNNTPKAAQPKSNKKEDKISEKKDDVQFLEQQEGEGDEIKEEESKPEEKEVKPEEGKEEVKQEAKPEEKPAERKPTGKVFKIKDGEGLLDIPATAAVPVKINGKVTDVPLQELVNNFSGKVIYEQKFNEVSKEKKELSEQKEYFTNEVTKVKTLVNDVMSLLDKEDGDPTEALYYLLDMTGRDVVQYKQKIFQSQVDKFNDYLNMDEIERKLFWTKEENEFLRKRTESAQKRQTEERQWHETVAQVDRLREAHGVSEEQYVTTLNELYALGYTKKEATPEIVVNFAVLKPHLEKAESLVQPYFDLMDDSDINSLIEDLAVGFRDKTFNESDAKEILEKHFSSTPAVRDLNAKAPVQEPKRSSKSQSSTQIESFDDFETTY